MRNKLFSIGLWIIIPHHNWVYIIVQHTTMLKPGEMLNHAREIGSYITSIYKYNAYEERQAGYVIVSTISEKKSRWMDRYTKCPGQRRNMQYPLLLSLCLFFYSLRHNSKNIT